MKIKKPLQKLLNEENWDELHEQLGGSTEEFWYAVAHGGYIKPEKILEDKDDLKRVQDAIKTLKEFEEVYQDLGLEG